MGIFNKVFGNKQTRLARREDRKARKALKKDAKARRAIAGGNYNKALRKMVASHKKRQKAGRIYDEAMRRQEAMTASMISLGGVPTEYILDEDDEEVSYQ